MASFLSTALPVALAIIMFSLGIGLTIADFKRVLTFPKSIFAGMFCQLVMIPLVAFIMIKLVSPAPEIALGIMILSFCPGGVVSNIITRLAGGNVALSISMTGVVSLLSVVTIPILVAGSADYFLGADALSVDASTLGIAMFLITALPAALGVALRHYQPKFTDMASKYIVNTANTLFVIIVIASVAANWTVFTSNFVQLGPMMVGLNIVLFSIGLAIARGLRLGGTDQTTISIETGIQNSALGITIGTLIVENGSGLSAFSLPSGVYAITSYFVAFPFIMWIRRRNAQNP